MLKSLMSSLGMFALGVFVGCAPITPQDADPRLYAHEGFYKLGKPYEIKGRWYFPRVDTSYDEVGIASWYGEDFHGKLTANGETYDMNSLSAAHRTLPLPVLARVVNLENGRSLVVRVNDRGPFANNRIIDLSKRSAEILGFAHKGVARVRVTYVGQAYVNKNTRIRKPKLSLAPLPGPSAQAQAKKAKSTSDTAAYYVQVGQALKWKDALVLRARLTAFGTAKLRPFKKTSQGQLYHVLLGPLAAQEEAESKKAQLLKRGYEEANILSAS